MKNNAPIKTHEFPIKNGTEVFLLARVARHQQTLPLLVLFVRDILLVFRTHLLRRL